MIKTAKWVAVLTVLGGVGGAPAWAGGHTNFSIGIGLGGPGYYRPWYPGYGCGYYRPYYPVYVAPPPVIVQPAPVYQQVPVVQQVPVAQPTYSSPAPAQTPTLVPAPAPTVSTVSATTDRDVDYYAQQLASADERIRTDSVAKLGKLRSPRAIDPLAATLSGDRSPAVREAAARALGLIGSPQALPALQYAAQSDSDRDVRRSAQFSVEVIQSRGN